MLLTALRLPLQVLPDAFHTEVWARILTLALSDETTKARLAELDGRSICLGIRDTGTRLHFRVDRGRLVPARSGQPDVTIHGELRDFLDLATRREDADTLFFHRRLCIEGDTETGLHIKNSLDALDLDWEARVRAVVPEPVARLGSGFLERIRRFAR